VRKIRAEPKANSGSKNFEKKINDIGDGGFEDETIGH
jgi:hypothetical protein